MRAAVLRNINDEALDVVDSMALVDTEPGFVRVAIKCTGVCHSDLSGMNGTIPTGAPCVLGHEGAGEVVEVGAGVTSVKVGDHVIVVWVPPCGQCSYCLTGQANLCSAVMMSSGFLPRFVLDGQPVFGFAGTGTFAEEVVLPQEAVVKVDDDVPFEVASLIGCGVMTGVGAAINSARVRPGSSVVVFGCGGVGISVIQGARIAGAAEIVAVDLVASKREDAKRFGATHAVSPEQLEDVKGEITAGEGFDYSFEVIGLPQTIRASYDAVRRGGMATIVGVGRMDQMVEFNAFELFYAEKTLRGTIYGSADVRVDFNRLIRLWRAGRLDLEGMITERRPLSEVNLALDDMKAGKVIRTVLEV
ncbi:MAG: Zn-dependent alcohol dehydrogenase [Actinobacteria bacterium]|nr:Zn-dependent alcohol dehydrogenase [Actinomycetota bacterium]